jgi:hypothetical protein
MPSKEWSVMGERLQCVAALLPTSWSGSAPILGTIQFR